MIHIPVLICFEGLSVLVGCKIYVQDKMEHWKPCSVRWFQILTTSLTKYTCVLIWVLGQQIFKMFHNTHTVQYTKLQCIVGKKMADLDRQGLKCGHFLLLILSMATHSMCVECWSAKATLGWFFVFELEFVLACLAPGLCYLINS